MNEIITLFIIIILIYLIYRYFINKSKDHKINYSSELSETSDSSELSDSFEHFENDNSTVQPAKIVIEFPSKLPNFNIPEEIQPLLNIINISNIIFELDLTSGEIPKTDNTGNYSLIPYCSTITDDNSNLNTDNNVNQNDPKYGISVFNDPEFGYVLDIDNRGNTTSCLLTNFSPGDLKTKTYTIMYWYWYPNVESIDNNGYTIGSPKWSFKFKNKYLQYNNLTSLNDKEILTSLNQNFDLAGGENGGIWIHMCVTFDGSITNYYIDGTLSDTITDNNVQRSLDSSSALAFGGSWDITNQTVFPNGTNTMKRRFTRTKFLNIALTQNQVSQVYYNDIIGGHDVYGLIFLYDNLYSKYLNLYIQSQYVTNRLASIENITIQYNQAYKDIYNVIKQFIKFYLQITNTKYSTTQNTQTPSYVPYFTPAVINKCGNPRIQSCHLVTSCFGPNPKNRVEGLSLDNICSTTVPAIVDLGDNNTLVIKNKSEVQLLDVEKTLGDIKTKLLKIRTNLNEFNDILNAALININTNIPIDQKYIDSQINAVELLISTAKTNITNLIKQTSNSNIINSLNNILNDIQNINTEPNIIGTDLINISKFYQNRIDVLIMLQIIHQIKITEIA
jgi:hypothetical protein